LLSAGETGASICSISASERAHSNFPSPTLALKYPKPVSLDGLVFDSGFIVSCCPYAIVVAQFDILKFYSDACDTTVDDTLMLC
jgi:hypothetical protein